MFRSLFTRRTPIQPATVPVLAYNADGALTPTTARAYQAATVGRDARKIAAMAARDADRAAFAPRTIHASR